MTLDKQRAPKGKRIPALLVFYDEFQNEQCLLVEKSQATLSFKVLKFKITFIDNLAS